MNARRPDPEKFREMRIILKAAFDCVSHEPAPKCMDELVRKAR
jgi:hypothetical protein